MNKPLSECKVLLVDDIKENINVLVQALKSDYKLGVALNGKAALDYAKKQQPDLILLDIMMPGMDGFEVSKRLKADPDTRDIPFIFITAIDEVENKAKGFENGAVDYITKPFEITEVKARVKTHLSLLTAQKALARQNEQMKYSLSLAMEVQQNLIPQRGPGLEGFDIAGMIQYCDETGGDYFDYIPGNSNDEKLHIVVGDVSDHGIPSALLMTTARAFLRYRAALPGNVVDIIKDVNRLFIEDVRESGRFMTLFLLSLEPKEKTMSWVRAGHDPGMLYSPEEQRFEMLEGKGVPLGISTDAVFKEHKKELSAGQIVVLFTDGIVEAQNRDKQFFGKERLQQVIRGNGHLGARQICDLIFDTVKTFLGSQPINDDLTVVVIKVID
jgi:sigma-B regulation protein RsbU (phosphoserine phosphatase)